MLESTQWTGAYRVTDLTTGTNTDRPIMEVVADVTVELTEGTYWVAYNFTGSASSGPWAPPVASFGSFWSGPKMVKLDAKKLKEAFDRA